MFGILYTYRAVFQRSQMLRIHNEMGLSVYPQKLIRPCDLNHVTWQISPSQCTWKECGARSIHDFINMCLLRNSLSATAIIPYYFNTSESFVMSAVRSMREKWVRNSINHQLNLWFIPKPPPPSLIPGIMLISSLSFRHSLCLHLRT